MTLAAQQMPSQTTLQVEQTTLQAMRRALSS
jgi:hypothetical protein